MVEFCPYLRPEFGSYTTPIPIKGGKMRKYSTILCLLTGMVFFLAGCDSDLKIRPEKETKVDECINISNPHMVSDDFRLINFLDEAAKKAEFQINEFSEMKIDHGNCLIEIEMDLYIRSLQEDQLNEFFKGLLQYGGSPVKVKNLRFRTLDNGMVSAAVSVSVFRLEDDCPQTLAGCLALKL
ncbi:MAG: hypothetical protein GF349_01305 [Candidatus Magasanikbacteria bacterium]|nr:hypothetical protein [Candidatus Magasanikbacteria bacterium]